MKVGAVNEQYRGLPTLVQPHMLDADLLAPMAARLVGEGDKIDHHLGAAGALIDLTHVQQAQEGVSTSLDAVVDRAHEQIAKCEPLLDGFKNKSSYFSRLFQVQTAGAYLDFYKDRRSFLGGGWDLGSLQKDAYATMQTTLLDPLLACEPRSNFYHKDRNDLLTPLRSLLIMQTLHRLQATDHMAMFAVFPANIRESSTPTNGAQAEAFDIKVVFSDQTFLPIKSPADTTKHNHNEIATISGDKLPHPQVMFNLAKLMSREVSGQHLRDVDRLSLDRLTRVVLRAMVVTPKAGKIAYPSNDSRTKVAASAKLWLNETSNNLRAKFAHP